MAACMEADALATILCTAPLPWLFASPSPPEAPPLSPPSRPPLPSNETLMASFRFFFHALGSSVLASISSPLLPPPSLSPPAPLLRGVAAAFWRYLSSSWSNRRSSDVGASLFRSFMKPLKRAFCLCFPASSVSLTARASASFASCFSTFAASRSEAFASLSPALFEEASSSSAAALASSSSRAAFLSAFSAASTFSSSKHILRPGGQLFRFFHLLPPSSRRRPVASTDTSSLSEERSRGVGLTK
mmetsp:Transcript_55637/g.104376  ORF Transcript_55637/g.104376 Transcript_55637/m.104376 type:complete len:245 (+) Transcript_55637:644-1378(+)